MITLTGPTAKPCRRSLWDTVASFQLHEGSIWCCVSFTGASGIPFKGNVGPQVESVSHIIPVYSLMGEIAGNIPFLCVNAPGVHIMGSGLQGTLWTVLVLFQSSLLLSRISKSLIQLQMKCKVNTYLFTKLCSEISLSQNWKKYKLWTQFLFVYHLELNLSVVEQSFAT